jgi:trehalose 6-phosphate phosphatase
MWAGKEGCEMPVIDLQTVLRQRPVGLVLDIDGTLSPLVDRPEDSRLYPGVASLLEKAREHAHVAIMTGRPIFDGAALVNVDGLTYIGTHGLEWSEGLPSQHPVTVVEQALEFIDAGRAVLDLAEERLAGLAGVIVQRKKFGGSIHYRLAPDPLAARARIWSALQGPARDSHMKLRDGKLIVELLVPLDVHKGQALRRFVHRLDLRGVLYAGDDRTDLDAVIEIARLRQEGRAALAVVVQYHDTLPELLEHADVVVQGVEGMVQFLRECVETLSSPQP